MTYNLGVVMNAIDSINPENDSTLPLLVEGQKRGWNLYYLTAHDLFLKNGIIYGNMKRLRVSKNCDHWFDYQQTVCEPIKILDALLMRLDPPVDLQYIYLTYLLERAESEGVFVLNRPSSLRNLNEKLFASYFVDIIPETLITSNMTQLKAFVKSVEKAVIKPLHIMGGQSVFLLDKRDKNCNVIIETITENGQKFVLIQKYIEAVSNGDKRVLLLNGEPVPYTIVRIAPATDFRCNIFSGASIKIEPLSEQDKKICEIVGPVLKQEGIFFAGIDIIGNYLTEINLTSPGCLSEISRLTSLDLSSQLLDIVQHEIKLRKKSQV